MSSTLRTFAQPRSSRPLSIAGQVTAPAVALLRRLRKARIGGWLNALARRARCGKSPARVRAALRLARWQSLRAKAYSRAADSLAALAVPLEVLVAEDRLTEIPGVGDAIADIITHLHRAGSHPSFVKLRKEIPAGVLEMLAVPGLRPEKVLRLYKDLGITSLAELEAAAKDDRIRKAKGLGAALSLAGLGTVAEVA